MPKNRSIRPLHQGAQTGVCLLANARQFQECGEYEAVEDGFVVRAYRSGLAMLADGQAQMSQQRPAAFVDQRGEPNAQPRAVIENAQACLRFAVRGNMGHVHGPDGMGGQYFGCLAAQIACEVQQLQLMRLDKLIDVGFSHALRCV